MLVKTQEIIEAVLQPLLVANGGPVRSIHSVPFRDGDLTEQTVESNKLGAQDLCVIDYAKNFTFANTSPAPGGQDCYPTITIRQLVGFMSMVTNAERQQQFVSNCTTGLARTLMGYIPAGNAESPTGNANQSRIARFDISTGRCSYSAKQVVVEFEVVTVIQFTARNLPYGN